MDASKTITTRQSIRAYLDEEIPEAKIREMLEVAKWAPSNGNTQPWHLNIISGKMLKKVNKSITRHIYLAGKQQPYFGGGYDGLEGDFKTRQYECANILYGTMGIKREQKVKRKQLALRNFEFFGAPHAMFISMPETLNATNALDIGTFLQSFMLVLVENGYGSIAQGSLAIYPKPVLKNLNIPEGNQLIVGLSFGRPDLDAIINNAKMPRLPIDDFTTFES